MKCGWNYLSIPKLQRCRLYWACHYLSMLGLKLNNVIKRGYMYLLESNIHAWHQTKYQSIISIMSSYLFVYMYEDPITIFISWLTQIRKPIYIRSVDFTYGWHINYHALFDLSCFWSYITIENPSYFFMTLSCTEAIQSFISHFNLYNLINPSWGNIPSWVWQGVSHWFRKLWRRVWHHSHFGNWISWK